MCDVTRPSHVALPAALISDRKHAHRIEFCLLSFVRARYLVDPHFKLRRIAEWALILPKAARCRFGASARLQRHRLPSEARGVRHSAIGVQCTDSICQSAPLWSLSCAAQPVRVAEAQRATGHWPAAGNSGTRPSSVDRRASDAALQMRLPLCSQTEERTDTDTQQ